MKPAAMLSVCFLALVAVGHLLRVALGVALVIGDVAVPMWPSVVVVLVTGTLSVMLWREQGRPA